MTSVHVGVLMQRFDDAVSDIADSGPWRDGDVVQHRAHAPNVSNGFLRALLLIQPVHFAGEREWPLWTTA